MKLSDLVTHLAAVGDARLVGDTGELEITRAISDSRRVEAGDLFVAVRGLTSDGHDYLGQALEAGATAVVVERESALPLGADVASIVVTSGAAALGAAVAALAGHPARDMTLVGITGTNGKTTTTYLVESILTAAAKETGVIGTVSYRYGGADHPAPYTTPTPEVLHDVLGRMRGEEVTHAVLEVSSAALSMDRLSAVSFDVAAFANLSQDHLDIHGDMSTYRAAKALLFSRRLKDSGVAVINIDDDDAPAMLEAAAGKKILRVSAKSTANAEIRVVAFESSIGGIEATVSTPRGDIEVASGALIGHYNVANVALAVGIAEALELDHTAIATGIGQMRGVPGRVQRVENDAGLDILVDYAHTPDALANVLDALRPLCQRRLICVFGCGGDRDPKKRPLMGRAVAERADLVIITSDNPRTEDAEAIINMITPEVMEPFYVDADRSIAIHAAVTTATPGDVVVIAGKGHEDYQILGTDKIHFDDREVAALAVKERRDYTLGELAKSIEKAQVIGDPSTRVSRIVIDGRISAPGDLYVAIRGERVNGHDHWRQALNAGAVAAVVERGTRMPPTITRIEVGDTRVALGEMARHVRRLWGKTLIGVTGSAGKTTTKELIAAALRRAHGHKSVGSNNNETGVPLTLLGLKAHHDVAVAEMGMRGLGQIDYLCAIAEPDVGVVLNAGVAHVGVIGSELDIVHGKAEMYSRLPEDGVAVYPSDDPRLERFARAAPHAISYGDDEGADIRLIEYESRGLAGSRLLIGHTQKKTRYALDLPLYGRHNALNACAAIAAAVAAGIPIEDALAGIAATPTPRLRGEVEDVGGRHLFIDCYNSNPHALRAALRTVAELAETAGGRAYAVLGDMLELGDEAESAHRDAGHWAVSEGIGVVGIGEFGDLIAEGARAEGDSEAVEALDFEEAARVVWDRADAGDWILFKASRGAKLERAVEAVRELGRGPGGP